jgi:hypothetical protein
MFHEHAHLYWDALPDDLPIKQRLLEFFAKEENPEEAAIEFIGLMGSEEVELEIEGSRLDQLKNLIRIFWARVKNFFGKADVKDLGRIMVDDIWNNRHDLGIADFVETEMKNQKYNQNHTAEQRDGEFIIRTMDGKVVLSPSGALRSLKKKTGKDEKDEMLGYSMAKRSKEYSEANDGKILAGETYRKIRQQLSDEWDEKAKIGTEVHKIPEMLLLGEDVPDDIKKRFAPGVYEEFEKQVKERIEEINDKFDNVEAEKLVYAPEIGMGGVIDMTGVNKSNGKIQYGILRLLQSRVMMKMEI